MLNRRSKTVTLILLVDQTGDCFQWKAFEACKKEVERKEKQNWKEVSFDTSTCIKCYRWKATCVRGIQGKEDDIQHDSDATQLTDHLDNNIFVIFLISKIRRVNIFLYWKYFHRLQWVWTKLFSLYLITNAIIFISIINCNKVLLNRF